MAGASANTPVEMWPKVLKLLGDIKIAASQTQDQANLTFAIEQETAILKHLQQPLDQMTAGAQQGPATASGFNPNASMGMPATPQPMPRGRPSPMGTPYGSPGGPGGAPNMDELRRMMPG